MIGSEDLDPLEQDAHSWTEAKNVVSVIGDVPRFFSSTIHYLKKDAREGHSKMSPLTETYVSQLLRSDSFKAAMYYAGTSYFPERIKDKPFRDPLNLARIYAPDELATIVSLLYLYRRIRKGCDPHLFSELSSEIVSDVDCGGILGRFLPKIGILTGLIVGGAPHLGRAMFLGVDKKNYLKYSEYLRKKKLTQLYSMEEQFWGCNQLQVSILLLQTLGFGHSIYKTLITGLSCNTLKEAEKDEELYRAKLARVWIDSLRDTTQPPQITHKGEFYPLAKDLHQMLELIGEATKRTDQQSWLNRGKKDLSPEQTPELFSPADVTEQKTQTEIIQTSDKDLACTEDVDEALNELEE